MLEALRAAEAAARQDLEAALSAPDAEAAIEVVRLRYLGKKGEVSRILKSMGRIPAEERPKVGQVANTVRDQIAAAIAESKTRARQAKLEAELSAPPLDVTLPGRTVRVGTRHPVSAVWDELVEIMSRLGYQVASGPEIEGDWYNFEALGIPEAHPARDEQDTFFLEGIAAPPAKKSGGGTGPAPGAAVLRTHTSPVQIRAMLWQGQPPIRIICPGKVYRRDSDLTHTPMFHQVEVLCVDRGITLSDLKGSLQVFARAFFGPETRIRLRPSYFPFTEPSAEVDVTCTLCGGAGCRTCGETGWIEVLGSGMVDPVVLQNVGWDPAEYSGFAWGMGIDRLAMLKYRIDDLRMLFENDARFLGQFRGIG
ncbi:MAG: phenylalanine--tRNA ligase subunit alpha [Deltaproteobacteria bacterium]|nr:MAG: phenylalanine--tRNA ligase subunit alpha [Deltaproteobacteria bacterium]